MRHLLAVAAVLLLLLLGGCGDSPEGLAKEALAEMKKMVAVLETVTDGESARAAKAQIDTIGRDLKSLSRRMKELEEPSEAHYEAIESRIGQEMAEVQKSMAAHLKRLSADPEVVQVLNLQYLPPEPLE